MSRRVSRGGGAQGAWLPLEIEKKKRSSVQILGYFTYILLLFLVENVICQLFSELGPPPEKLKSKKKKKRLSDVGPPPPLRIPGHAPDECKYTKLFLYENSYFSFKIYTKTHQS